MKPFLGRKNDFMKMFPEDIKLELGHAEHISKLQLHVEPFLSDFECFENWRFSWIFSKNSTFPVHKCSPQKQQRQQMLPKC